MLQEVLYETRIVDSIDPLQTVLATVTCFWVCHYVVDVAVLKSKKHETLGKHAAMFIELYSHDLYNKIQKGLMLSVVNRTAREVSYKTMIIKS